MKRWIESWHPGQLVLALIAGLGIAAACLMGAAIAQNSAADVYDRRELAVRDSVARLPVVGRSVSDSVKKLEAVGTPPDVIEAYLVGLGLQDTSFKAPTRREQRIAALLRYGVAWPAYAIAAVTPLALFLVTWMWFGGRQRRRPTTVRY